MIDTELRNFFLSEDLFYVGRLERAGRFSMMADYYKDHRDTAREVARALDYGDYITVERYLEGKIAQLDGDDSRVSADLRLMRRLAYRLYRFLKPGFRPGRPAAWLVTEIFDAEGRREDEYNHREGGNGLASAMVTQARREFGVGRTDRTLDLVERALAVAARAAEAPPPALFPTAGKPNPTSRISGDRGHGLKNDDSFRYAEDLRRLWAALISQNDALISRG